MMNHTSREKFWKVFFGSKGEVAVIQVRCQDVRRISAIRSAFGTSPVSSLEWTRRPSTKTSKEPLLPSLKITDAPHSARSLSARPAARWA